MRTTRTTPADGRSVRLLTMLALGAMLITTITTSGAAPVAAPGDDTKASKLRLAAKDGEPGRWARAEARLSAGGEKRYYISGADISAPLSIQVIAQRLDVPVRVTLHRQSWAATEAEGTTGDEGLFRFEGRAYGDVGIRLRTAEGEATRATVLVWQGDPVPPTFLGVYAPPGSARAVQAAGGARAPRPAPSLASDPAEPNGPASGGTSPVMIAILAALVVIAALLGVLVFRRGGAKAASVLAGVSLSIILGFEAAPATAQQADPFDVPKEMQKPPLDADKTPRGAKDAAAEGSPSPGGGAPDPFDVDDKDWKPPPRDAAAEGPKPGETDPKEPFRTSDAPKDGDGSATYRERIEAAEQNARALADQVAANRAELERLRLLVESDRDNEVDPDRVPPMPISCRPPVSAGGDAVMTLDASAAADEAWENFEECQQCYREPLAEFERQLVLYERLRVLYSDTSKFVTKVISIGDQAPKPHYLLENAWAAQKTKIRVDFAKTQQAYDAKLEEFNGKLSDILDRIGDCETRLNGNPMWRSTSGTFFYHAMANGYKRTD